MDTIGRGWGDFVCVVLPRARIRCSDCKGTSSRAVSKTQAQEWRQMEDVVSVSAPLRRCKHGRCNVLTRNSNGRCDEHAGDGHGHNVKYERDSRHHSFAWTKYSQAYRRAHPLCVNNLDCRGLAEVVDHIEPVSAGGDFWDSANHQPMCSRCHNRKRQSERRDR